MQQSVPIQFFNQYSVIIAIIFCIFILIALIVLFKVFKVKISFGKFSISKDNEIDNTICFRIPCSFEKISYFIVNVYDVMNKINEIKNKLIEKAQIKYIKQKLIVLKEVDLDNFFVLLKEKSKEKDIKDLKFNQDEIFQMYNTVMDRIYTEILMIFGNIFDEKHIDEYEEISLEWQNYIDDKIIFIISEMNRILKSHYIQNTLVSFSTLNTYLKEKITANIEEELEEMFYEARRISTKYKEEIKILEKQKQELLDNLLIKK